MKNFLQLPQPPSSYLNHGLNNLIDEETSYNMAQMEVEYKELLKNCNAEQLMVYVKIMETVHSGEGGLFFRLWKWWLWQDLFMEDLNMKIKIER